MRRSILFIFGLTLSVFLLSSCSDGKDGRDGIDLTKEPEIAMSTKGCVTCHSQEQHLVAASKHIYPSSVYYVPSGADCDRCHNPDLDYSYVDPTAKGGLSCTSCHELDGSVKNNPMHSSYASNTDNCIKCHEDLTVHGSHGSQYAHYFPYSNNIAKVFGSVEESYPGHGNSSGKAIREGDPRACGLCHSGPVFANITLKIAKRGVTEVALPEGGKVYRTNGGANEAVYANFDQYAENAKNLHLELAGSDSIGCDSCHDSHSLPGDRSLRSADVKNGDMVVASSEFMLCTSCHVANVDIAENGKSAVISALFTGTPTSDGFLPDADASLIEHHGKDFSKSATHSILDTHFAGTLYAKYSVTEDGKVKVEDNTIVTVKGYGVDPSARNACTGCHDAHGSSIFAPAKDSTEYASAAQTWGQSKHAADSHVSASCAPCHVNRSHATAVKGNDEYITAQVQNVPPSAQIACLTCHEGSSEIIDNASIITGENLKKLRVIESAGTFKYAFEFDMTDEQFNAIKAKYPTDDIMLCGGCHAGGHGGGTVPQAFQDSDGTSDVKYNTGHYPSFGTFTGVIFDLTTNARGTYEAAGPLGSHIQYVEQDGCLSCHATDKDNHGFAVYSDEPSMTLVRKDCVPCHTDGVMFEGGENTRNQVKSLQKVITAILPARGVSINLTTSTVPDESERYKLAMALGNLAVVKADSGLYAHTNKKLIKQIVYDNMMAIKDYINLISLDATMDLNGATKFNGGKSGEAANLDSADIANVKRFFDGFTR